MIQGPEINEIYLPVLLNRKKEADNRVFTELVDTFSEKIIIDQFPSQKQEIFKIQNPKKRLTAAQLNELYLESIKNKDPLYEGIWVFYPWLNQLIHLLDKEEFILLRTSRNQHRISAQEQKLLSTKKIGIIGLSIGHSVAMTIATERICGKLKLADFDVIELSNLNRIRTGVQNIGLNKSIVTAREIAQIDPFFEIECYTDGITEGNLNGFLTDGGNLDILVDECDGLEIKIAAREAAKELHIPVIMDTSDRGMVDVERFDIEHDRALFHGLIADVPPQRLKNIAAEDRLPLVLKIVDAMNGSNRGRASMLEIGQTITTWPQLATAATLGGAAVADATRRIFLNQFHESGRYYVDLESIISDKKKIIEQVETNPYSPFDLPKALEIASSAFPEPAETIPETQIIEKIVKAASLAPSTANDQPWKWIYLKGRLFLFHDFSRSFSFANFNNNMAYVSFGAAYENILLESAKQGLKVACKFFPVKESKELVASFDFSNASQANKNEVFSPESVAFIPSRSTNRNPSAAVEIPEDHCDILRNAVQSVDKAVFRHLNDRSKIMQLGTIIGECDRMMMLHKQGHHDFFERDLRWPGKEPDTTNDGIDLRSMGMGPAQIAALSLIRDKKIARTLKEIGGGNALVDASMYSLSTASLVGFITLPKYNEENFFKGGIAMERLWLKAEELGYAIHPMMSPLYLFPRLPGSDGLDESEKSKITELRKHFLKIMEYDGNSAEIFLFKIAKADKPAVKTTRLPLSETLFIANKEL